MKYHKLRLERTENPPKYDKSSDYLYSIMVPSLEDMKIICYNDLLLIKNHKIYYVIIDKNNLMHRNISNKVSVKIKE